MPPEKDKIKHCFNRAAPRYDSAAHVQSYVAKNLLTKIAELSIHPAHILDLGAGTGHTIPHLQALFPEALVLGLDFAYSMCVEAKKKMTVPLLCMDFDKLAFAPGSFDLVFSSLALQWSIDLSTSLREINAALAPQAYFAFTSLSIGSLVELDQAWQRIDQEKHINHFLSNDAIEQHLAETGFELIEKTHERKQFEYDNVQAVLRSLKAVGANHVLHKENHGLNARKLLLLEDMYPRSAKSQKCPLTYEISYILSRKKNVA